MSKRWQALADDQTLWKILCHYRGWKWKQPALPTPFVRPLPQAAAATESDDDEGMGDSDAEESPDASMGDDSGFASMSFAGSMANPSLPITLNASYYKGPRSRHSAPSTLQSSSTASPIKQTYKLLYQTHIKLLNRFHTGNYQMWALQTRGAPANSHSNTIYCLQLYTYPATGEQVLFTGSRDKTVREWDIRNAVVRRVFAGGHTSSVLSLCVKNGLLASGGSDRRVVVWSLDMGGDKQPRKVLDDHEDSVLCVRFDEERLVSCSKGSFFTFPFQLLPVLILLL